MKISLRREIRGMPAGAPVLFSPPGAATMKHRRRLRNPVSFFVPYQRIGKIRLSDARCLV